jgi:hypothetical protein
MEKKHIIRFLKEKKRGVYTLIVEMYADVVTSMAVTMALEIIKEDLEKDLGKGLGKDLGKGLEEQSGTKVDINYFSLAQAISKYKKEKTISHSGLVAKEWAFKDTHELKENQTAPGKFKINQVD